MESHSKGPDQIGANAAQDQPVTSDSAYLQYNPQIVSATTCAFCGENFPSRSSLFRHLRRQADGCPAPREDPGEKIMILFGYTCFAMRVGNKDGEQLGIEELGPERGDNAGDLILHAMGITGFGGRVADVAPGTSAKPGGYSQASAIGSRRCPLLVQEIGVSATADTACLRAPTTVPVDCVRAWLKDINTTLCRSGVQLFGRMAVPSDLHAEAHATRRRYEYLIPTWLLDETAETPWAGPARSQDDLVPLLKRARALAFRPFGSCNFRVGQWRRRCPLWHNFTSKGLPHSPSVARRLYRFYARECVVVRDVNYTCLSVSGDAFVDQQVRGMVGLAVAGARGLVAGKTIADTIDPTRQEDILPIPLAPAVPCWLAEVSYATWQSRLGGGVCMSPGAAQRSAPPLEGWSDEAQRSTAASFRQQMLESAARWWETKNLGRDWLCDVLEPGAMKVEAELMAANERAARATDHGGKELSLQEKASLPPAPSSYAKVLRLLREADTSGLWPATNPARDSIISGRKETHPDSDTGEVGEASEEAQRADGEAHKEQQQRGGTFTVGAFPPPYPPPRGNLLFPELTRAAFELEGLLMPNRPPSSSIAVNRHACFRPHIDSGSGAGQSISLIVGLGDYVGGEIVIEGQAVDVRHRPVEFNGWTQRHWTRSFKGERYSLVWFTPKGCEGLSHGACIPSDMRKCRK